MRAVFFGTPDFAVPTLAAMVDAGLAPERVITQPARPVGRGHKLKDPPVAAWAKRHDLEVWQPPKVNRRSFRSELSAIAPDVAVVVAFGQIFRPRLLALPHLGCINLHASLLPRHRGAAPIQAAIAQGDPETGVTTMRMTAGLDSGPMLLREAVTIGPDETTPQLAERLAFVGAELMIGTLRGLADGSLEARQQDEDLASYAPQLTKADGVIDWSLTAPEIYNRLRAYQPWPGQASELRGTTVKVRAGRPLAEEAEGEPGTFVGRRGGSLAIACGDQTTFGLEQVQLPGKKPVSAMDFANGQRLAIGERFSSAAT